MDLPESTPPQNPPPPPAAPAPVSDKEDIEKNKDIAAFSYLWIMSVVVFFLRRNSPFVRYHAKQAMLLFLLSIIVLFVPIISKLLELGILGLMVLGFINAAQGQRKDVPIIGPLSRREIGLRDAWKQIVEAIVRCIDALKAIRVGGFRAPFTSTDHESADTSKPSSPPSSQQPPPSSPAA